METLFALALAFLVLVAILWFVLPFAIFGTKPLLRELIDATKKQNELLRSMQSTKP